MELTFVHYLVAFIAFLINVLQKIKHRKNPESPFNLKFYFKNNWIDLTMSALSIILLFLMVGDFLTVLDLGGVDKGTLEILSKATYIIAFVFGWFNYSFIRFIVRIFKKKVPVE